MLINVDTSGTVSMIHSDDMVELLAEGRATIKRASHVEPTEDGQWQADLSPVDGPTLGPFALRSQALAAEVEWLETHIFGADTR